MNTINDRNVDFLNKVYQNAEMGTNSISYLTQKVNDPTLMSDLQTQHRQYSSISNKASEQLATYQMLPKDKGPLSQASLWSSVQLNTMIDKTPDHIAEMMIQGSMMGVIDMTRTLKQYADTTPEVQALGQELISLEENNIQKMKQYLQ